MSSFLVIKKNLELSAGSSARMLVGKQNRTIPEQILSGSNSIVTTMKKHFDFDISYAIDPTNGQSISSFQAKFPSGKYDPLSAVPSYAHHRFLGWHTQANDASNEYAVTVGSQKTSSDSIDCLVSMLYGNWQATTLVTMVSQMQDWNPEMGHDCYVGQQYGQLPSYTSHSSYDSEVEYLENVGLTQFIKTGVIPTNNTKIIISFNAISRSDTWSVFFGSTKSDNSPNSILLRYYNGQDSLNTWFGQETYSNPVFATTNGIDHTVILEYGKCTYDGIEYSIKSQSLNSPYEIYLFAGNYPNGTAWRPQRFKCYYFKVYENNILVRDMIPVRVGQVGYMYDKVSGELFGNQGSGNFKLGNDCGGDSDLSCRFLGWHTQQRMPDKTVTTVGNHITSTSLVSYRPTLYALWQLPSNITFDATTNGGAMQPWSYNYYMTMSYGELPPVDDRQHYYYEGWFTQAIGGMKVTATSIVPGDTTLYAQWSAGVTITFDATTNGGEMPSDWISPDYFAGHTYDTLPVPTHSSLAFVGWYLDDELIDENSIVPAEGATLVAQYAAQTYTVDISNGDWVLQSPNTNPDPDAYNGVYQSDRYHGSPPSSGCVVKMYINTVGYQTFDVYIRSNGENGYSYTIAVKPDIDPSSYSEAMGNALADTNGNATGTTSIDGYTKVTYDLGGGNHRICIAYIHKDSYTVGDDRGYVLIPKSSSIDDGI